MPSAVSESAITAVANQIVPIAVPSDGRHQRYRPELPACNIPTMEASIETDPDVIISRVLEYSVPLHDAIRSFDEPAAAYRLEGAPGVALFERDAGTTISHVSSSPSPMLMPVLDELRKRHLERAGCNNDIDNSHLPALLLLCMYLVDPATSERFSLDRIARRPAEIVAIDEESGRHDPELEPHDAALRAWTPLIAEHAPDAGSHSAVLEMRFKAMRHERYVPW